MLPRDVRRKNSRTAKIIMSLKIGTNFLFTDPVYHYFLTIYSQQKIISASNFNLLIATLPLPACTDVVSRERLTFVLIFIF